MTLGCVGVQVWITETVDEHGKGRVETCHADRLRVVKDEREGWTEGPRWPKDLPWMADTW